MPRPDSEKEYRNREIARLVSSGKSYRDVTRELGIKLSTVAYVVSEHYPELRSGPGDRSDLARDRAIRKARQEGVSVRELCEEYSLTRSVIWEICKK